MGKYLSFHNSSFVLMARPQCEAPLVCIMEGTAGSAFPGVITGDPYEGACRDHLRLNLCGVRNFAW
jgi:hypothetical protein